MRASSLIDMPFCTSQANPGMTGRLLRAASEDRTDQVKVPFGIILTRPLFKRVVCFLNWGLGLSLSFKLHEIDIKG